MNPRTDPDARAASPRSLVFILLTVGLDSLGLGILVPVIPRLILDLTGQGLTRAAVYGGWLVATFAAVQFLAGPILGSISDRIGRRPVLLVSLAAFGCSYILMGVAPTLPWLFVAQVLTGLFGATPATAGAYIADISATTERTRRFGATAAAYGTGLIIGPALGGILVAHGTRLPFFVAACLSLLTVIYGFVVLPESLPPEKRRRMSWQRAHPFGAMQLLSRTPGIASLFVVLLLQRTVMSTLPATWPYFTMQQYGWSARDVGYSLAGFGLASVLSQVWLLRWVDARIGTVLTASVGLMLLTSGYLGLALINTSWITALCIPLATMGFMAGPALVSVLSGRIASDLQGTLQGVVASLSGVAAVLTPLVMPRLFSVFSGYSGAMHLPGAPYLLGAAMALVGVALIRRVVRRESRIPAVEGVS